MWFKNLWEWWLEGLAALWPNSVRRWLLGQRKFVWASLDSGEAAVGVERGSTFTVPGLREPLWKGSAQQQIPAAMRRRLRAAEVVIRLPENTVLKRTITIPPEAPALGYVRQRLDDLSPFTEDQTCFDVIRKEDGQGVELVIAQKSEIDKRVSSLSDVGLNVTAVTVEGMEHTTLDLLPHDGKPPVRRDAIGATVFTLGLAACAAAVTVPFIEQSRVLEDLGNRKANLERTLSLGDDARQEIDALRARVAAIGEYHASRPGLVTLLAEVTDAVPDHSWVRQFVVRGGELMLQGESEDTADLITRLEGSRWLYNVRYDTAITRDTGSGKDRFSLKAETRRDDP